ncbi:hypothetical protein C2G38_2170793 [Gigaspora rosea]|uniref:Uncharacterized protein n=1 Tax=Gigaspora rosea TaxID=44941 RepID=A0A397VPB6_9GLOM|nr:hypothetical protein C2G38_2170793 [Gigaspora rosea]
MKTPSISRPFKNAYTISVSEHIKRVLSNRTLGSQMYFGPGIEAETKSELGFVRAIESIVMANAELAPLKFEYIFAKLYTTGSFIKFKSKGTRVGRIIAIVSTSSGMKLKVQRLYYGSELPKIFATSARLERLQNGELWLGKTILLIDSYNIIGPTSEILYSYEGQWKMRDIKLWHRHPIEYTQTPVSAPQNVLTFKIMLDIYYNDFKPIVNEIKNLEKGVLMNVAGQDIYVIAALGVITADLPQGNDLANTNCHSSKQGCRSCLVPKDRLSNFIFDIKLNARYHHLTDKKLDK